MRKRGVFVESEIGAGVAQLAEHLICNHALCIPAEVAKAAEAPMER